jgi:hypothetical protein
MPHGNGTNIPLLLLLVGVVVALVVGLFANDVFPRRQWGQPTFALPRLERQAPSGTASPPVEATTQTQTPGSPSQTTEPPATGTPPPAQPSASAPAG